MGTIRNKNIDKYNKVWYNIRVKGGNNMSIVEELYNEETGEINERLDFLLRTECENCGLEYPENCVYRVNLVSREHSIVSVILENIPWKQYTEIIVKVLKDEDMMSTKEVLDCTECIMKEIGE